MLKQIERSDTRSLADEKTPNIDMVPPELLPKIGVLIEPHIRNVVERSDGSYTYEGLAEKFRTGEWTLWIVWTGTPEDFDVLAITATTLYREEMSGRKVCFIP